MRKADKANIKRKIVSSGVWLQKTIYSLHIYSTFQETLVKFLLFVVSYSVSVLCYYGAGKFFSDDLSQTSLAFGSSVTVYGLSLIIEVVMYLNPQKPFREKFFIGIIMIDGIIAIFLGLSQIFAPEKIISADTTIFICAISLIVYLLDTMLFYWVRPPEIQLGK